jgi:hypothetical protein
MVSQHCDGQTGGAGPTCDLHSDRRRHSNRWLIDPECDGFCGARQALDDAPAGAVGARPYPRRPRQSAHSVDRMPVKTVEVAECIPPPNVAITVHGYGVVEQDVPSGRRAAVPLGGAEHAPLARGYEIWIAHGCAFCRHAFAIASIHRSCIAGSARSCARKILERDDGSRASTGVIASRYVRQGPLCAGLGAMTWAALWPVLFEVRVDDVEQPAGLM